MNVKAKLIGSHKPKKSIATLNSEGSFELLQKSYRIASRMREQGEIFGPDLSRAILNLSSEIVETWSKKDEIKVE
jgi:hypothetical protein